MPLSPQTIGQNMSHGFAGSYARQPDMIVNSAPLGGAEVIPFGTPLVRGENGEVIPMGTGNTGNQFIGVAGREVKSATELYKQNVGQYAPEEPVSVFQRGCINVKCQKGTPVIDGTVYVRVVESDGYAVGGFEAEADGENTVALLNAQWNGPADSNGVAELRIAYVGPVPAVAGSSGEAGEDGGYYQPSVSEAGVLSWTASKSSMPTVEDANIKGPQGEKGADGVTPSITATATVDASTGTPGVTVTKSGTDEAPSFAFAFTNLKGADGATGAKGADGTTIDTVNVTVGTGTGSTPTGSGSVSGTTLALSFDNLKGEKGDAGSSYTLPDATTAVRGGVLQMSAISDLTDAPTMEDFNNLLAALRTAGMLATS